ncbi:Astacin-like metalloprotease toxin 1 [Araneus ventricosus]|uniref:Metalloendopeptidase n=2 Tax=Araneus ventricosus TaxID=182803 RepID=A0A4Y2QI81_ARAVE|nr:Astacin-like metalloprotease toxin 1 [Araneus ventricosus]GBN63004.1 Astacin-like metalloprotease toxin 1 [Araneus ventricosus]
MKLFVLLGIFAAASAGPAPPHDPMINEGLFEGDILLDPNADRNAIPRDSQRWPGGVVPYFISPELAHLTERIRSAMKHIEDNSCIRFKQRTNENDHIKIFKHSGCYSHWGRIGNQQLLSLGNGCEPFGTIVHELLHAIGFEHEHNRSDRDEYLNIYWDNIVDQWYYAFKKLAPNQNRLLTKFDYNSIMLYGSNSFVKQWGKFSMTPKDGKQLPEVYDKKAMSASDAQRIRMLYNC